MSTIDDYAVKGNNTFDAFTIDDIRKRAEPYDSILEKCFDELLDEGVMITSPIHKKLIENIDAIKRAYGANTASFYNEVYIAVLQELVSRSVDKDEK